VFVLCKKIDLPSFPAESVMWSLSKQFGSPRVDVAPKTYSSLVAELPDSQRDYDLVMVEQVLRAVVAVG
jgi:hypothetical protein